MLPYRFAPFLYFLLAAASLFADTRHPRIAVGGLSAESNSLYPAANPMIEPPVSRMPRAQWLEYNAKANTVASGVVTAAAKLDLEIVPVLQAHAGSLGYVER